MKTSEELRLALCMFILVIVIKITPDCKEGSELIEAIEKWVSRIKPPPEPGR